MNTSFQCWDGLAHEYANYLEGESLLDARAGLFLWAPKASGKTAFLRQNLIPEIIHRKWLPIYLDLDQHLHGDPQELAGKAIWHAFNNEGALHADAFVLPSPASAQQWSSRYPPFDILAHTIEDFIDRSGKPVVFIIDEVSHALGSGSGKNLISSLKSARDTLNKSTGTPALMLVFSSSSHEKMDFMVKDRSQPFYCSLITTFPYINAPTLPKDRSDSYGPLASS